MQTQVQSEFIKNKCTTKVINITEYFGFCKTSTDKKHYLKRSDEDEQIAT